MLKYIDNKFKISKYLERMYLVSEILLYSVIDEVRTENNRNIPPKLAEEKTEYEIKDLFIFQINKIVVIRILVLDIANDVLIIEYDYKPDDERQFTLKIEIVADSDFSKFDFTNFINALFDILKEKIVFKTIESDGEEGFITLSEFWKIHSFCGLTYYQDENLCKISVIDENREIIIQGFNTALYFYNKLQELQHTE